MSETREPANADMYQMIPRLAGDIASGRVERDSFSEHVAQNKVPHVPKKIKKHHAAAGKSGSHWGKRPVACPPRNFCYVSHIIL